LDWIVVYSLEYDSLGILWIASDKGLFYFDKADSVIRPQHFRLPVSPPHQALPPDHLYGIMDMCVDYDGNIWMLQGNSELIRFNPYSKSLDFIWPRRYEYTFGAWDGGLTIDGEGKIWFGNDNGLMQYDPTTEKIFELDHESPPITDILIDKNGNILVAHWEGVKTLDKQSLQIKHFTEKFLGYRKTAQKTFPLDVYRENNLYWIGTNADGLVKLDISTGKKSYYYADGKPGSLSSNYIPRIIGDNEHNLWVMAGNVLHLYNPHQDQFQKFPFGIGPYVMKDDEGFFWLCGRSQLLRFDPNTYDTTSFPFEKPLSEFGSGWSFGFVRDSTGTFWFAGIGMQGLYRINAETGKWRHYLYDIHNPSGLPAGHIHRILLDSKKRLWTGSLSGLSQIITYPDSDSISCINYFTKDGLCGNEICGLTEDHSGNIWIGTFTGMSVLRSDGVIENFTIRDGLPEVPMIWVLKTDHFGNILAGTIDIVEIPPDFLLLNEKCPPVLISDFQLSGESIVPGEKSPIEKSILFCDRIKLKFNQNFFRIEFAALNYTHPEKNRYRYLLSGIDQDTVDALNRSYAEYTDLRPGKYTFWVTGSNNTGLWNETGKSITITIHPPWYRSFAAYSVYFILFVLAGLRYRQFLINREKEKAEMKSKEKEMKKMQEIDEMKSHFFSNISHEFRTPLTLIIGNAENLLEKKTDEKMVFPAYRVIRRNAFRLLRLVNQLLDLSKLAVKQYKLQVSQGNVFEQIRIIVLSFTSMSERKKIRYAYDIPREEPEAFFDPDVLEKVLYNLLSNAFKFTPEGGEVS
jgi:streptogramin lyase